MNLPELWLLLRLGDHYELSGQADYGVGEGTGSTGQQWTLDGLNVPLLLEMLLPQAPSSTCTTCVHAHYTLKQHLQSNRDTCTCIYRIAGNIGRN